MTKINIFIIPSLKEYINNSDRKTKKLFEKQKEFMEDNSDYPSLGKTKLINVFDKYENPLWEIRLDRKRRIVFFEKDEKTIIWLKICTHDELNRNNKIRVKDTY